MEPTPEDEEMRNIDSKLPQNFNPLGTLERVGSSESVQHWIDSLTADDWKSSTEDRTGLFESSTSSYGHVELLVVPETADDDLMLGADAKSLSFEESDQGFPPRLSPLFVSDEEQIELCNNSSSCHEVTEVIQVDKDAFHIKESKISTNGERPNLIKDETRPSKLNRHQDSLASFPSVSSLLAAMETDPEDVLISLGFCDDISSQVRRIPARFFMTPSQAKGIDVQKVLHQVMNHDSSGVTASPEDLRQEKLSNRFSESSIDLSLVDYGADALAKLRRTKFSCPIPSITVSEDIADEDVASEANTHSRNSGYLRLSTVLEENEPGSRRSSLSRSFSGEKKKPFRKQDRVEVEESGEVMSFVANSLNAGEIFIENKDENSISIIENGSELQKSDDILSCNAGNKLDKESNMLVSDDNNNCDIAYLQSVPVFPSFHHAEVLTQSSTIQDDINELSSSAVPLVSEEENVGLDPALASCEDKKIESSSEIVMKVERVEGDEPGRVRTASECSYPDSIEEDLSLQPSRGFLTDVKMKTGDALRQFSSDSLQDSPSERGSLCEDSGRSDEEPVKERKLLKDSRSSSSSGLARVVYRSLGKIEIMEDRKDTVHRTEEVFESRSMGYPESKAEFIITSYMPSLGNETDDMPHRGFSQSCYVDNEPKKRSPIRDYFRKLASGRKRRFFSLESLNTIRGKGKFQKEQNPLFPNRSSFADDGRTVGEPSGSWPFRKRSDSGIEKFREPVSGKARLEKKSNTLDGLSFNGNDSPRLSGKENAQCEQYVGFTVHDTMNGVLVKQNCSKISPKMNGQSLNFGINGEREFVNRQARKVLLKGCSIESSGFEDENGACRSSPERGWRSDYRVESHQICELCMQRNVKEIISEVSLPAPSDRDRCCLESSAISDMHPNSDCDLTKDRFEYLVVQMTSLREEINEQEERLKRYIDESMEKMKASILTEISLLNAFNRTGSSNISLNIEH